MARNEEKQQGKLNRLWLQKEREEGRLKDVNERRPKLSALNSAPSVKKWIPSIKSEIEYYLQQSQLPHYPERKIAEFQLRIEALEKEYKSFIAKLRVLDPTCKHKPWTPRAYSKRRAEAQDSPAAVKNPRLNELHDKGSQESRASQTPRRGPVQSRTSPSPSTRHGWRWLQLHSEDQLCIRVPLKHRTLPGCCSLAFQILVSFTYNKGLTVRAGNQREMRSP
ncbi:uncharacterized protein si:dkey-86e18.1 isoform X2 [Fundulus heteroclitus]|uniref:uncharacterized protein si:dkey-86e18.1 isoform X2 n=1 Tax=Fundulus heteroclitus TaxID=8078 RepID=UPI00165C01C9|nr:uncharacterized protein si:dkey-86e18.1 isoform X2 [Fundulus heteroclitus]